MTVSGEGSNSCVGQGRNDFGSGHRIVCVVDN